MHKYLSQPEILAELDYIYSSGEFSTGQYIYMAMATINNKQVCIATAYKIDYCLKKALQFIQEVPDLQLTHINKVKIGELVRYKKFELI